MRCETCGVEGNGVERIPALEAALAEKDAEIERLERHVTLQKDVTAKSDCEACGGLMWIKSACPSCPNCKRPATEGPKPEPASSVSAERAALMARMVKLACVLEHKGMPVAGSIIRKAVAALRGEA